MLDLPLDLRVLSFTIAVATGTALLCGLAPAIRATNVDLTTEFQGGTRLLGGGRSRLARRLMVVQIALPIVLLVGTGLFVGTLRNLRRVNPGFNQANLVLFFASMPRPRATRRRGSRLCTRPCRSGSNAFRA